MGVALYYCYRIAAWLSRAFPLRVTYRLAVWLSALFYAFDHRGRGAVMKNVEQILAAHGQAPTRAEVRRLTRSTFAYFGKYLTDFFRYAELRSVDVGTVVAIEHPEFIQQAAAAGRGVIAVSAHFGNWEMAGAVIPALGYKIHTVVLPQRFEKVNRLFQAQRARRGFDVSFLGNSAMGLMRALRRGEFVGLLADRDFSARNDPSLFFGKPAQMPRGPAYLAHRMRAAVLPGFVRRREDDSLVLHLYPPIMPGEAQSEEEIHARIVAALEDMIGRYPDQWFVFREYWPKVTGREGSPAISRR